VHAELSGVRSPKQPMKVLVVDADSENVQALVAAFRNQGCVTFEATSFEAAKRLWMAEQPPMLIADIRLGQYNGLQLLLRAKADRPDVVAVITCSVADTVLEAETRRFGGTFLVKPVTPDAVCATLLGSLPNAFFLAGDPHYAAAEPISDRRMGDRRQLINPQHLPDRRLAARRKHAD
jgi:two-component system OmpR family response regulator